jgi:hypothetical protein
MGSTMRHRLHTLPISRRDEQWTIGKRRPDRRYFNEIQSVQEDEPTLIVGAGGTSRPSFLEAI